VNALLARARRELGLVGLFSVPLLAAGLAFSTLLVKPLEEKNQLLTARKVAAVEPAGAADKVAAVYEFLERSENTTDWLAKLHGIVVATGLQLKSVSYRTQKTEGRIVRYEIVLPVTGSYTQIRDFLKRSLAEIPVLSVDQVTLKREGRGEGPIQVEMRLTLHMVKS